MLVNDTPELRRLQINLGHPKVYVAGVVNINATTGIMLPTAPKLCHLEVTGDIGPQLVPGDRYIPGGTVL